MVTMWKLSSYDRNIEIQDGGHIIRHAVFKEGQMSLTLVFLYLHFVLVQIAAIFNFTMTAALPVLFRDIEHTKIHVHVSWFLSPTYSRFHHISKVR